MHTLNPILKFFLVLFFIIATILSSSTISHIFLIAFLIIIIYSTKIPLIKYLKVILFISGILLITFIIIFIVCSIGVAVLWWLSDLIINLPIVKQLDTLGGVVFGALNGILIVFVAVSVLGVTSQYILRDKPYEERRQIVNGTFVYKHFEKFNPITGLLSSGDKK